MRRCGDCQLCCRLLPMKAGEAARDGRVMNEMIGAGMATPSDFDGMIPDFTKAAGCRCVHQRHGKGCAIYARRPFSCRAWNCRWLVGEADDTPRPDHAHYVIDVMPDVVRATQNEDGKSFDIPAIQVWIDQRFPDAHRDPALRRFLARRGETEGAVALIRFNAEDAFVLWPPAMTGDGQWHEATGEMLRRKHFMSPPEEWTRGDD